MSSTEDGKVKFNCKTCLWNLKHAILVDLCYILMHHLEHVIKTELNNHWHIQTHMSMYSGIVYAFLSVSLLVCRKKKSTITTTKFANSNLKVWPALPGEYTSNALSRTHTLASMHQARLAIASNAPSEHYSYILSSAIQNGTVFVKFKCYTF